MAKLKGGRKKEPNAFENEVNDNVWQERPFRKFNFDDDQDETNQTDFLSKNEFNTA